MLLEYQCPKQLPASNPSEIRYPRATDMLAAVFAVAISTPVDQPIRIGDLLCHPQRLLAKFESRAIAERSLPRSSKMLLWIPEIRVAVIETRANELQSTRRWLQRNTRAQYVEFDRAARPAYDPNDPMWPDMWHMTAIKANLAWDHSFGSDSVTVAVIDTGVNLAHEDLAANAWVNADEIPSNGIDDDNNGYIDDVNGYDFAYNDPSPNDVYGHGTACAGLVAAVQDNGLGVTGVAPRAKIMAIKASIDSGFFYDSATVPAYIYCANNGARVLSMSYFSDRVSSAEGDAITYCVSRGVLPVAAAGNDSTVYPYYPGAYDATLSVAALNGNLNKAGFSNHGLWVDVAAPGTGLRTTSAGGGYTDGFGGTSGACPHVAGLAALLFGANPVATAAQVRAAIEDTAVPVNQSPYGEYCNYGRVDAEAAVLAIMGTPAPQRAPVVRAVTGVGQQLTRTVPPNLRVLFFRVVGRGFQPANTVEVLFGNKSLPVLDRSRDWIAVAFTPPTGSPFQLKLDGVSVASLPNPTGVSIMHPLTGASTPEGGAQAFYNFADSLNADANYVRTTRRNDGSILMHGTFSKVTRNQALQLVLRRQFVGTLVGTETVQLYDWSTNSYPYGDFVTLSSGPVPTSMTTTVYELTNPSRFVDPEGTVYLRILTSDDLPSGAELRVDQAHLAVH